MISTFIVSIEKKYSPRLVSFFDQPYFKKINFKDISIIGVKGAELNAKEYFHLAVQGRGRPLSPGEVGCSLSHIQVYKQFLQSNDKYALIFEDDAVIPNSVDAEQLSHSILNLNLPTTFLLSLGGIQLKVCQKIRGKYIENKIFNKHILKVNPHFYSKVCYTFAYVIDRKMAELLLIYHEKIRRADDWSYLYDFNKNMSIYMTNLIDHPIEQNSNNSCIEGERLKIQDIKKSIYGIGFSKELAKLTNTKYNS